MTDENKLREETEQVHNNSTTISDATSLKCIFCGYNKHKRIVCQVRDAICKGCSKKGNYVQVCRSSSKIGILQKCNNASCASTALKEQLADIHPALSKLTVPIAVNQFHTSALIDTGSYASFIC